MVSADWRCLGHANVVPMSTASMKKCEIPMIDLLQNCHFRLRGVLLFQLVKITRMRTAWLHLELVVQRKKGGSNHLLGAICISKGLYILLRKRGHATAIVTVQASKFFSSKFACAHANLIVSTCLQG